MSGKYVYLPEDAQDLLHFFLIAKPEWSPSERRAVFAKLSAIEIRDVSGLLCALHASGDQSLNAKLRSVGQKPFHWRTLQAFEQQAIQPTSGSRLVLHSTSASCLEATKAQVSAPPPGSSESPNWEAPASAGWWRVVSKPTVWAHCAPDTNSAHISIHCYGKLLAMTQMRYDISFQAYWLKLRDERSCTGTGQWILSNVSRAYGPDSGIAFGDLLERVCEPGCVPCVAAQDSHKLSVKAFRLAQTQAPSATKHRATSDGSLWGELHEKMLEMVNAAYQSILNVGCHTLPFAAEILPEPFVGNLQSTINQLVSQSYVVVNNFLDEEHTASLVEEAKSFHESGRMEKADPHQTTSGQRDDYVCWIDETRMGHSSALQRSIRMLKAVAHALSPALSRFHHQQKSLGHPAHLSPPAPPASMDAVLTVPPKAMLSCYPGNGARYIPHTDSKYLDKLAAKSNPRELTAIVYANPSDWQPKDGGALTLYPHSQGNLPREIQLKPLRPRCRWCLNRLEGAW